ncbi:hypothetical protein CYLTODRAFT_341028 [Cylindrobasidium torrendii FP15055 ss-10]|uniref:1-alkyl-2-acetylglycerophosphocholine esterase n=1 Tax=Cylindrobasidium torrendii FP15055 ss-10 TaxID=1314674 RepID=A0A0D7BVD0_9AGAR|nr:hypothetical protein CYLTODRAFT_341028 [Cylindrobasidium torrendii FP15055 ss-10]
MVFLAEPLGYPVGSTTFVTPIQPPLKFGDAKTQDGKPALELSEVAFTAYYPTDTVVRRKKGLDWLLRPLKCSLKGFVAFAGAIPSFVLWPLVYFYGAILRLPVYPNAPLLRPKQNAWPLVIFSHGLGGSRTAYSQICSRMAATGKVVIAIEHRDGTSPCCITNRYDADGKPTPEVVYYLQEEKLHRPVKHDEYLPLRQEQLQFRCHEVHATYSTFLSLLQAPGSGPHAVRLVDGSPVNQEDWTSDDGKPLVEAMRDVTMAGHSFGGCTAFHVLSTLPPEHAARIPITKMLIYDPWLDPIPSPGPRPLDIHKIEAHRRVTSSSEETLAGGDTKTLPELVVINSEQFTLWTEHFERLDGVVKTWGPKSTFVTLAGSSHAQFSDFLTLPFVPKRKRGMKIMDCVDRLSNAFVDGRLEEQLEGETRRNMEVITLPGKKDKWGQAPRKLAGDLGDIIVH